MSDSASDEDVSPASDETASDANFMLTGPTGTQVRTPDADELQPLGQARTRLFPSSSSGGNRTLELSTAFLAEWQEGAARYRDFALIAEGGVGTIVECLDPNLQRPVAMKRLQQRFQKDAEQRARFLREARILAQLAHPNIVPVHEVGTRPDGSLYFTMKRVEGVTLQRILKKLESGDKETEKLFPRARLLDVFVHVCEGIAFAHSRDIIHRDLKPDNILLGAFGEVLVMDWGLAKFIGDPGNDTTTPTHLLPNVPTQNLDLTLDGAVSGTPLYMAPEQAMGKVSSLDVRADVYSLGAILYEILTFRRATKGKTVREALENAVKGQPVPPRERAPARHVPAELDSICMKAIAKFPDDRYSTVQDLLDDVERYRRGLPVSSFHYALPARAWKWCHRHPMLSCSVAVGVTVLLMGLGALELVQTTRYRGYVHDAEHHRQLGSARYLQQFQLQRRLGALRDARTTKERPAAEVMLEQQLQELHREAEEHYQAATILYSQASHHRPDRNGAGASAIADIFANRIEYALGERDYQMAARWLGLTHQWLGSAYERLPAPERTRLAALSGAVQGDGYLTALTRPKGIRLTLWTLQDDERGMRRPTSPRDLGPAPIRSLRLPQGSYLLTGTAPGRPAARFPIQLGHAERLRLMAVAPADRPDGTVYVPAGAFLAGGEHARYGRLRAVNLEGFFIRKHEVSFGEYLRFWRAAGGPDAPDMLMGRIRLEPAERRYVDAWSATGELRPEFGMDMPVVGITLEAAQAYCRWLTTQVGRLCRLPTADEWEKAARGVDGRGFVWGDEYRAEFALTAENHAGRQRFPYFAPGGSFAADESVYGAMDMGGNAREWTSSRFPDDGPFYQIKGASAATTRRFLYCAHADDTPVVPTDVGFRYVMPLDAILDGLY